MEIPEKKRKYIGYLCLASALLLTFLLIVSMAIEPRAYRNVLLLDGAVLTFFGALAQLTRHKTALRITVKVLVYLIVPLMTVMVSLMLLVDGGSLLVQEGFSVFSALPMLMGALLLTGMVLTVLAARRIIRLSRPMKVVAGIVVMTSFYITATFGSFAFFARLATTVPPHGDYDYILVHGFDVQGEVIPPILRERLEKALELHQISGKKLVLSGGKGSDRNLSEAMHMHNYLASLGVPEEEMILEERSATTVENLEFVQALLDADGEKHSYVCVTSDYHVLRTIMLARRTGMEAQGVGSQTDFQHWVSAMIREYVAIMAATWYTTVLSVFVGGLVMVFARPKLWTQEELEQKQG